MRDFLSTIAAFAACGLMLAMPPFARSAASPEPGHLINDFDGPNALHGWSVGRSPESPGAYGDLSLGPGHVARGAVLNYRFSCAGGTPCGGYVVAFWSPASPFSAARKAAMSLWARSSPEVRIFILVRDKSGQTLRYRTEVTTLEHREMGEWRRVVVPLAAKPATAGDDSGTVRLEGRIAGIGILVEPRYPQATQGTVGFDDIRLLESSDQTFNLSPAASLVPAPPGSSQLAPRLGVNIHARWNERTLDMAREAGFRFVRMDLEWSRVERSGQYRFFEHDRLLNALDARGMGVLWILDYGHPGHGGATPRTAEDIAAFARYAEAAAAHYRGRNVRYEIWNEPNLDRFWKPSPNAAEYAVLLREAVAAIRRSDPLAVVCSGGLAKTDLPFLDQVLASGAAHDVNAIGVHPYLKTGPESVVPEFLMLRELLTRTLRAGVQMWDTEWGYASYDYFSQDLHRDGHSEAGRERQAVLAVREVLSVWALGLPLAVWYDLRDDGFDPANPEHNYGLLDSSGNDKPAMKAVRTLGHMASTRIYAGMVQDVPDGMHAVRLDGPTDTVFVVWSERPDARLAVRFPTLDLVSAANMLGEPVRPKNADRGNAVIGLDEAAGPLYLCWKH